LIISRRDAGKIIQGALVLVDPGVRQFTYPLFGVDNRNPPDLYASSVLLEIDARAVLVTAAHAIFEITQAGGQLHVGMSDAIAAVPPFVVSSSDGRDPLDLAVLQLPVELLHHFRTPLAISSNSLVTAPHLRCIHGYPLTKNNRRKNVDEVERKFEYQPFTYAGASSGLDRTYVRYKKDPDVHIALKYQKKSRTRAGNVGPSPNPRGISGGGLWQVPDIKTPGRFALEGIAIEFHRFASVVFATRIDQVVSFIRSRALS
jgi:hypothetical protein